MFPAGTRFRCIGARFLHKLNRRGRHDARCQNGRYILECSDNCRMALVLKTSEDRITKRDIVVIGTSAGGLAALKALAACLPRDLSAAVLVVRHTGWRQRSDLPEILASDSRLGVSQAEDRQVIEPGHIYVAPPDRHLLVEPIGRLRVWRGPKEDGFRPAINALFRSAAVSYKERVVGVILTGRLEDGVTGLEWIKRNGGIAVVQHPEEAALPDMPLAALRYVEVDYIKPVAEIPHLLSELSNGARRSQL